MSEPMAAHPKRHTRKCTCAHFARASRLLKVRKIATSIYFKCVSGEQTSLMQWLAAKLPTALTQLSVPALPKLNVWSS